MRMDNTAPGNNASLLDAISHSVSRRSGDFYPTARRINNGLCWLVLLCSLLVMTCLDRGSLRAATVPGTLDLSSSSANFSSVGVGSSKSLNILITNVGRGSVTISKNVVYGAEFSTSGVEFPVTIASRGTITVTLVFKPKEPGNSQGSVEFASNATNATVGISLTGTGTGSYMVAVPSTVSFGSVVIGATNTQTVQIQNRGASSSSIIRATVTGAGFHFTNLSTPDTLVANGKKTFDIEFAPTASGSTSGALVLEMTGSAATIRIPLSGTGVSNVRTISVSPSTLSFGNEELGGHETLTVTIKNTGNSNVTVSSISESNSQLGTSGGVSGATLSAGQSATLNVTYSPTAAGAFRGQVTVNSNATDTPLTITATGTAFNPSTSHTVALKWNASSSPGIEGYYVYRSTNPSSGFAKLNSSYVSGLNYTDDTVSNGNTYYYAVTAVNSSHVESTRSSLAEIAVP